VPGTHSSVSKAMSVPVCYSNHFYRVFHPFIHHEIGNGGTSSTMKPKGQQAQEDAAEYQRLRSEAKKENRLDAWEEEIVSREILETLKVEKQVDGGTEAARTKAAKILQQQLERIVS